MNRLFSALGALLVLGGAAILVYVGVSYAKDLPPSVRVWSQSQQASGRKLQSQLAARRPAARHVAVSRSLASKAPATGREPATRMVIPKINLNSAVVQTQPVSGVWEVADWSVGHLTTTPNPGAPGNGAYAAHDDIKGEIFKREDELAPGDRILLYTAHRVYRYRVVSQVTVDPTNVSVLAPTARPTISLISCTPYWVDTQRLVVKAVLQSSSPV